MGHENLSAVLKRYATAGFFLAASCNVLGQTPTPAMVDIAPCMALADNVERYACYDALAASVSADGNAMQQVAPETAQPATVPRTAAAPAVESPPVSAEMSSTAVAEFGKDTPSKTETAQVIANENGDEELHDVITDLSQREPNRWLITLESGQVWYQSNSERFRLAKGMAVRIYPSPLRGSYRLARDDGKETGFIQVQRID